MQQHGLTTMNIKKINKSHVYHYIYQKKRTCKLQIVQDLQMGLSTVSQNLTLLEEEGLIRKNGFFDSTGGRKAYAIEIIPDFRISIGIALSKNMVDITAIDLYGTLLHAKTLSLPYSNTAAYYDQVAAGLKTFIRECQFEEKQILGVSIATQGIISSDHTTVTYGRLMDNLGMHLTQFSSHIPYPCHLIHDSKAAASLELWNHPELENALVFLLNRNIGGALITHRQIHQGQLMHGGCLEHLCIDPEGPLCYCGNRGCLETYCSADALERMCGLPANTFFSLLRKEKSPQLSQIWEDFLDHFAFAIKNLNMVLDAPIILSGYLAPWLTEEDICCLLEKINSASPFPLDRKQIFVGLHGQYTVAIGAALHYIRQFLSTI